MKFTISGLQSFLQTQKSRIDKIQDADELMVRFQAHQIRQRLTKSVRGSSGSTRDTLLGQNRRAKAIARRPIRQLKRRQQGKSFVLNEADPATLVSRYRSSKLLEGLFENRASRWVEMPNRLRFREHRTIDVEDFCFLTDPQGAIQKLSEIAEAEARCLSANINFRDKYCKDVGAWLLLAAMRLEMADVFNGGHIANPVSKVLQSLRLSEALGFRVNPVWSPVKDVWAFPLASRRPAGTTQVHDPIREPQDKEKVGDQLCMAMDEWLGDLLDQQLTKVGRIQIKKIVGEALDNAERYARQDHPDDGDWMVSGFVVQRENAGASEFRLHLAFLSVGQSISDTLERYEGDQAERLRSYVRNHKASLTDLKQPEEHLKTIFALQDGVTSDEAADDGQRGGVGFGDMIQFFTELAGIEGESSDAVMALVSGRTCLHIRYPYCHVGQSIEDSRELWFNPSNSEKDPPDRGHLFELDGQINGTLITMGFRLDRDYLERTADDAS